MAAANQAADEVLAITVLGASGDLAKKMIYPVLWSLYKNDFVPEETLFVGYARSKLSHSDLVERLRPYLKVADEERSKLEAFFAKCKYVAGQYDEEESFKELDRFIEEEARKTGKTKVNRVFYMALPPSVFEPVTANLSSACMSTSGWTRVIVEKPFGKDSASFEKLHVHLSKQFTEDQIYRIDHYLGKEMVQNLFTLRFANEIFSPTWNRHHIASVIITMKENFGTQGRGGYFDEFGIVRDVMQNHLLQMLTLCAMEKPVSNKPDDVRDEKVKVLKAMAAIKPEDIVLGQYVAGNIEGNEESFKGYKDDEGVPADSKTPTFATAVFHIRNERWQGVPFIIRCGKALNEKKAELRVQFRDTSGGVFGSLARNELVMRVQPDEAVYLKLMVKKPGPGNEVIQTDLNLSYGQKFEDVKIPPAYERLILDVIRGDSTSFVRSDELQEAWRIFTPILHQIDAGELVPEEYEFGGRGPLSSDVMVKQHNFSYTQYDWKA